MRAHVRRWFEKNADFDREITERFGQLHQEIVGRKHEDWLEDPRGRLAYVIVLDQFSRNMFRDNPHAFATDAQALAAAADGVARGHDKALTADERTFLYMPFMHSEDLATQERSVDLFRKLAAEAPPEQAQRLGVEPRLRAQASRPHCEVRQVPRTERYPRAHQHRRRMGVPEGKRRGVLSAREAFATLIALSSGGSGPGSRPRNRCRR